jgi:hypothetical protein
VREESTQTDTFVLRIWRQRGQQGWRGWVQHTRTGESVAVQDMDQLVAFVERHVSDEHLNTHATLR